MERWRDEICQTILTFLMAVGVMLALFHITKELLPLGMLWFVTGAFCAGLSWGANHWGRRKGTFWLAVLAVLLGVGFWCRNGLLVILDRVFRLYEDYYEIQIPLPRMLTCMIPELVGALAVCGGFCAAGAAYGLSRGKKQMLYVLLLPSLILLLLLLGGEMPQVLPMSLGLLAALGSSLYSRMTADAQGAGSGLAAGQALFLGGAMVVSVVLLLAAFAIREPVYEEIKIQKAGLEKRIGRLQDYRWDQLVERLTGIDLDGSDEKPGGDPTVSNMGMSGGQIADAGTLIPGYNTVLKVEWLGFFSEDYFKPELGGFAGDLYLKAFDAGMYGDNSWQDLQAGDPLENPAGWNALPILLFAEGNGSGLVRVTNVGADDAYRYGPELSVEVPREEREQIEETLSLTPGGRIWRMYTGSTEELLERLWQEHIWNAETEAALQEAWGEPMPEARYNHYAEVTYLDVPVEIEEAFRPFVETAKRSSSFEAGEDGAYPACIALPMVRDILWSRAYYTYEPGIVPAGKDLLVWFLTENGKGYCTHFASAGVMLFRMLGVPARYCEGYRVSGGTQSREAREKDAHAWVEVFVPGAGWLPVEVTPGFGGEASVQPPEMPVPETEAETKTPEAELPGKEMEPGKKTGGSAWAAWLGILCLAAGLLAGALSLIRRQRKHRFRQLHDRQGQNPNRVLEIYAEEYAQLKWEYLQKSGWGQTESPGGKEQRWAEQVLDEAGEARFKSLRERAVYSRHRLTGEETAYGEACLARACAFLAGEASGLRRLLFTVRYPQDWD